MRFMGSSSHLHCSLRTPPQMPFRFPRLSNPPNNASYSLGQKNLCAETFFWGFPQSSQPSQPNCCGQSSNRFVIEPSPSRTVPPILDGDPGPQGAVESQQHPVLRRGGSQLHRHQRGPCRRRFSLSLSFPSPSICPSDARVKALQRGVYGRVQRCSKTVGYHKPTTLAKQWHPHNRASWMGHRNIASTHCSTIWCAEAYTQETFRKILAQDETPRAATERGALVPALHTLHGMGYL